MLQNSCFTCAHVFGSFMLKRLANEHHPLEAHIGGKVDVLSVNAQANLVGFVSCL